MLARTLALYAALTCIGCQASRPFDAEDVALFEGALRDTHTSQGAAGTLMTVTDGEGRRWAGAMGSADLATDLPATEHTLFRTASIAKTFTGALILSLHEEGRLSVDDALSEYVTGVPDGDSITLRMLLQHTSGIPNYTRSAAYRAAVMAEPQRVFTYEELVALALTDPPDFAPGTGWNYSNTGYILLGIIAESIVGRSIDEENRARFFGPLGMHDTRPLGTTRPDGLWTGYRIGDDGLTEVPYGSGYPADGGYVTSLGDLTIWARAFLGGQLHREDTLTLARMGAGGAILDSVASAFGFSSGGYGLGLVVASDDVMGPLYAGAGNADGVRTFVGYVPDDDLAFVVAVNVGDGSVPIVETLSSARSLIDVLRARHVP